MGSFMCTAAPGTTGTGSAGEEKSASSISKTGASSTAGSADFFLLAMMYQENSVSKSLMAGTGVRKKIFITLLAKMH